MPLPKSKATGRNATGRDEFAALFAELREGVAERVDQVPDGFLTAMDWGRRWGVTQQHALKLLTHGMRTGRVEYKKFRVPTQQKKGYSMPHYREVSAPVKTQSGFRER